MVLLVTLLQVPPMGLPVPDAPAPAEGNGDTKGAPLQPLLPRLLLPELRVPCGGA